MVVGMKGAAAAACDGGGGVEGFIVLMKDEDGRCTAVTRLLAGMSCCWCS